MRDSLRAVLFAILFARFSNAVRPSELSDNLASAAPQHRVDPKLGPTPSETDKNSTRLHMSVASGGSLVALATSKTKKTGGGISDDLLNTLFDEIDVDKGGTIDKEEWAKKVKGPWKDTMFDILDADKGGEIDKKEWTGNWDKAQTAVFKSMGGDDGKIDKKELGTWKTKDFEKVFAQTQFMADDGVLDGGEFEQFLFTAMLFCATSDGKGPSLGFSDISASLKTKFGWTDEATFKKAVDEDGNGTMELEELYKYLMEKKKAFAGGSGKGGGKGGGGGSGSMRASLTSAVFVAVALFTW